MAESDATEPLITPNPVLTSYYDSLESRLGYRLLLGGARHFGWYQPGTWNPFPIGRSLRRMEQKIFDALEVQPGGRVLDAGAGDGFVALYMAEKGLNVTAIEYHPRHVQHAKRRVQKRGLHKQVTVIHMDYHHLESIPDESHDGVYTSETFVHATDAEGVLSGFHRILKPGGQVVLHEYDNQLHDPQASGYFKDLMGKINEHSAMPTNERSRPGFYKDILEGAGFVDVKVTDLTENIRPMLFLFWLLAFVPYIFVRLFRLEKYFINTVAGATAYWGTQYWRYLEVVARKAGGPLEVDKRK